MCGSQRAGLNIAPAVAPDGTIYTVSRAQFNARYSFLIALNSDLSLRWVASLRNRLHDGCGVAVAGGGWLPANGTPGGCRDGALPGVDPATNQPGDGSVLDDASSSPVVAPDGSILFGAWNRYNYAQGHLMHFDASGNYLGAFGFGWDTTPAIYAHGGTWSVVTKNNHYGDIGSYCDDTTQCPVDRSTNNPASPEQYFITQLDANLNVEWSYQNTNTNSCTRNPDGSLTCTSDHPAGFEWCVNSPAIDANGVVYANSEDGNMYAIGQGGTLLQNIFQQLALGAAYTPASIGGDGKIYSQNDGHLFVVGQ
jgi:outer membrane protein assembly factor BamB